MKDTYVLVHGACGTGAHMEATAEYIRSAGHTVFCPTLASNQPDADWQGSSLDSDVSALIDFIIKKQLTKVKLVGHSYAGMVISQVADRIPERIGRLIYCNAFVPMDGQSLIDLCPPAYQEMFAASAKEHNGRVTFPFPVFRDAFINDADIEFALTCFEKMVFQSYKTCTDPARLSKPLAQLEIGKSYVNCQQDTAMPHSLPWHPRLSERLGLFRLIEIPGSHSILFTNPQGFAKAIIEGARD